jgi:hypothetical protein
VYNRLRLQWIRKKNSLLLHPTIYIKDDNCIGFTLSCLLQDESDYYLIKKNNEELKSYDQDSSQSSFVSGISLMQFKSINFGDDQINSNIVISQLSQLIEKSIKEKFII